MSVLNRAAVELRLFDMARQHVPPEFFANRPQPGPILPDLVPTCGHGPSRGPPVFWNEFLCEPRDKLLQTALLHTEEATVEWEYLCNETNILDRLCKSVEYYRNPEVGQTSACFWECAADQLQLSAHNVSVADVKARCLRWLREKGERYAMGPDCSLPLPPDTPALLDDGSDHGTRCTLGEYVKAARGLSWSEYVDRLERPETWADVLCLFALSEAFGCTIVVLSKTFPYPDFCCRFGKGEGPLLLFANWKGVQFRSLMPRDRWDELYERMKKEKGLEKLDHRLYAGLLRYQDRTDEAIVHSRLETERDPKSLVGHHTWSIVLSDKFRAEEAMQHYLAQLEIAPDHPHSYNGVGTTLHDMRRYEEAILFYKVCVACLLFVFLKHYHKGATVFQPAQQVQPLEPESRLFASEAVRRRRARAPAAAVDASDGPQLVRLLHGAAQRHEEARARRVLFPCSGCRGAVAARLALASRAGPHLLQGVRQGGL
jgi:tetratricopeptide (TPR) repeat protein